MRHFLLVLSMGLCLMPAVSAQEFSAIALSRPGAPEPTEVEIDMSFSVIAINERTESFDVEARLYLTWFDQRQAFDADALGFETARFSGVAAQELLKKQLWWPYFEIVDAQSAPEQMYLLVEIDSDGWVYYTERFRVVIDQPFDLRYFPWDSNHIQFSIQSFHLNNEELVFVPVDEPEPWSWNTQEWDTQYLGLSVAEEEGQYFSTATAEVVVTRKPEHYIRNTILPLILIVFISSAVFWMNLDKMHLGDRLGVSFTSVLTVVAFDFVSADGLPKLGYATSLDQILVFAYVFSAVAIAENVLATGLHAAGRRRGALALDWLFRVAHPTGFVAAVVFVWQASVGASG